MSPTPPVALTIAGSDSGGGAGIAADLATFSAHGVFGTLAITAITAQDTAKVHEVHPLEPLLVGAQIDAVLGDLPVASVKTGMLATAAIVHLITERASRGELPLLVIDPVMVATSGGALLEPDATPAYRELLSYCIVATPNLPEAEVLLGHAIPDRSAMAEAAEELASLGPKLTLIKGGHLVEGDALDVAFDDTGLHELAGERIETVNVHGTGCTLSASIAAGLAWGLTPLEAVVAAKSYVAGAISSATAWRLGSGSGPIDHFPKA